MYGQSASDAMPTAAADDRWVTCPAMSQDTYLLDHGWSGERERLEAIAALFDPGTRRHLAATGLGSGWRCLEVGGGTGDRKSVV